MPIYEYSCDACGHDLEALQALSDALLVDCPECGEPSLRKRISAAAFRLKGGGWYETDFKSGNKRNVAGEGGGGDSGGKSDGGSSEGGSAGGNSDKGSGSGSGGDSGSGSGGSGSKAADA